MFILIEDWNFHDTIIFLKHYIVKLILLFNDTLTYPNDTLTYPNDTLMIP